MLENFRAQKIIWDRANKKIFETIEANSGDSNGRKLVVQVINQETTENLFGTTLSLGWKSRKGAKGLDAFNVVDASKGIYEIYYTTEMLSNIGNLEASLILIDSTSRIESSTFTISVRPSTVDDESVESENSFTALTEALVKVNEWNGRIDDVEQDYANRAEALEETYAPRLTEVTAQLAQTQHIYLSAMGVSHTKTATENTSIIKQAVAMAVSDGREIVIPSTPDGEFIDINESIIVNGAPITISGYGRTSKVRQLTFKQTCFSLETPGQKARSFSVYGTQFNGYGQGASSVRYSGIDVRADDVEVSNIYGDNIVAVVRVTDQIGIINNAKITDVESGENVIFNLLATGTRNLYFNNIRGSYKFFNQVSTPPHLIYLSEDRPNYNVNGGKAFAYGGKDSFAFQFKGMVGGKIDYLYSEECEGALHLMYAEGLSIGEVRSIKDQHKATQGQGALAVYSESSDITIDKVDIEMESSGKPVLFFAPNSVINDLNVISNHPEEYLLTTDVDVRGDNVYVANPKVKNIGAGRVKSSIELANARNGIIDNPTTAGNETGIFIADSSDDGVIINYKPSQQTECNQKVTSITPSNIITGGNIPDERSKLLAFDDFHILTYGTRYKISFVTSSGDEWLGQIDRIYVDVVKGQTYTENEFMAGAKKWIDVGTPNLILESKITHKSLESLVFRVVDNGIFLGAMIISNKAVIYEYVGGNIGTYANLNILASVDFVPQQGRMYYQKVDVYEDQVDYYINDQLMCSTTLDSALMDKFGSVTNHGILGRGTPSGTFEEVRWISNV